MIFKIFEIDPSYKELELPAEVLTLKPFVDYVEKIYGTSNPNKQKVLSYILDKFHAFPEVSGPILPEKMEDYEGLLEMIYSTTSPILEEEQMHFWALCMPISPVIIYSSDALYFMIMNTETDTLKTNYAKKDVEQLNTNHLESCYSLILNQCYNIGSVFEHEIIYPYAPHPGELTRHFKITFDTRFTVVTSDGPLPALPLDLQTYDRNKLYQVLQEELPIKQFRFEGISLMSISDVTAEYAVETIRQMLLSGEGLHAESHYPQAIKSLKTLAGNKEIEFGLFPLLKVNNKYIFNNKSCCNSLLMTMFEQQGNENEAYYFFGEDYMKDPRLIFLSEIPATDQHNVICTTTLNANRVMSYAVVPIYFNNVHCGILEIYSKKKGTFTEEILRRVEPALPFIAQIFQKHIDEFDSEIDQVVKKNFTAVQPAVQWKFIDAAWHYIRDSHLNIANRPLEIEDVYFENVYPLYGAVDLKNSTIERNAALLKDLQIEFNILIPVLEELRIASGFGLIDEKIFTAKKWLEKISNPDSFGQESRINEFIETDIIPFLKDFRTGDANYNRITAPYFDAINVTNGLANENRRKLESSMSTVISAVNNYMEMMKDEMQKAYPCYFEKFKTDGVEYDVYIGQSLAPHKPFKDIYLNNLRLMQLTSMAAIAKYVYSLQDQLTIPMETTQLIFIHSYPIEIKFRKDEKRFDVEGAYNIRYQVIKKRIDKVHLRGSKERLTAPDKIALVYFNQKEADEYAGYIRYLQEKKVLEDNLEYLELEQLQGVSGLKAMRVGVRLN